MAEDDNSRQGLQEDETAVLRDAQGATASDAFAFACERTAIAVEEEQDRQLAVAALAAPPAASTAVLTESTRSGGTRELPASLRAVRDAAGAAGAADTSDAAGVVSGPTAADAEAAAEAKVAEASAPDYADQQIPSPQRSRSVLTRRRTVIAAIAAVAVLAVAGIGLVLSGTFAPAQVDEASVQAVLKADADFMQGFASDAYVEATPYALSDVRIVQQQRQTDGSVAVDAAATLANESFESDCLLTLVFARADDASKYPELAEAPALDSGWAGALENATATTRAVAGVSRDDDFPEGFSPTFDAVAQTCSYTAARTFALWFGESTVSTPYTYAFDGEAWTREAGDATVTTSYDASALAGGYAGKGGDAARVTSFTIANVDAAAGTFTVEYEAAPSAWTGEPVRGVISCTLTAQEASTSDDEDGAPAAEQQADGYVYLFSGDGTSSGGEGAAHLEGSLGLDGSISLVLKADYTKTPLLFGGTTDETMTLSGTLAHE